MKVTPLTVGSLQTNCYLVSDDKNNCIIVDPGDEADYITETILTAKLKPQAILLTHGHYDHVLGCLELKLNFNIPICLHQKDQALYQKATRSYTLWTKYKSSENIKFQPPPIDFYLADKQTLNFGNLQINIIHTPGHTPGSCSFLIQNILFTGDTLFATGPGRAERSYSSKVDLQNSLDSLQSITCHLPNSPLIYPGHEEFGISLFVPNSS